MNVVRNLFQGIKSFFSNLFSSKKVVLANQEAIQKMKELDDQIIHAKINEVEKSIVDLAKDLQQMIEMEKINQEFLLYLCTTNEELLNTIGEGEIAIINGVESVEDSSSNEDEFLNSHWNTMKKGNILN
jgi:hypothetical protein